MGLPEHLQGLLRATAYPHPVDAVRVVETPLSWVLIAGERTYKLKRPVRLPFVNQSRLEDRQRLCLEELRLNRRFAPGLYLGVTPISAEDGLARIGGDEPIEHAVVMRSFAADDELDRLVAMQRVAPDALESFGRWLAQVQAGLPRLGGSPAPAVPGPAGAAARNMQECLAAGAAFGTATRIATIAAQMSRQFDARAPVLAKRLADGFVRECHADLHLSNIVRIDGRLLPFDCLEFDPALRWIDVAEDVAFLYMDLLAYDAPTLATGFLNGWLQASGDYEACTLLRLYGSDRAMVRAKVMALRGVTALLQARHGHYLRIAASLLQSPRPRCVMMCGVPGSGKSWLAARLAAARSAVIVRSDIERRRLGAPYDERGTAAGLRPDERLRAGGTRGALRADLRCQLWPARAAPRAGGAVPRAGHPAHRRTLSRTAAGAARAHQETPGWRHRSVRSRPCSAATAAGAQGADRGGRGT